jgi:integrating conjugative element protein (TIGR03758 family)
MALALFWAAWLLINTYQAWVKRRITFGEAGGVYIRATLLIMILIAFFARFAT